MGEQRRHVEVAGAVEGRRRHLVEGRLGDPLAREHRRVGQLDLVAALEVAVGAAEGRARQQHRVRERHAAAAERSPCGPLRDGQRPRRDLVGGRGQRGSGQDEHPEDGRDEHGSQCTPAPRCPRWSPRRCHPPRRLPHPHQERRELGRHGDRFVLGRVGQGLELEDPDALEGLSHPRCEEQTSSSERTPKATCRASSRITRTSRARPRLHRRQAGGCGSTSWDLLEWCDLVGLGAEPIDAAVPAVAISWQAPSAASAATMRRASARKSGATSTTTTAARRVERAGHRHALVRLDDELDVGDVVARDAQTGWGRCRSARWSEGHPGLEDDLVVITELSEHGIAHRR